MNKLCGYNCEHNKGGQCQITYCDKIGEITTTTQWLSGGRQQGKTYQLIKDQQKEIERLTAESTEWESKCYKYQDIIELATYYIDNYMYEDYAYCGSEDRLKQILLGNDFILKQLKELKEGK